MFWKFAQRIGSVEESETALSHVCAISPSKLAWSSQPPMVRMCWVPSCLKQISLPLNADVAEEVADVVIVVDAVDVAVLVAVVVLGRVVTVEVAVEVADDVPVVVCVEKPQPA